MDDRQIGAALRVLRTRRGKRQQDVATEAGVPRRSVIRIESGLLGLEPVQRVRAVAAANGAWLDIRVRSAGGDVDRLLNAGHAAMQEIVTRRLLAAGWQVWPEASFSIYGERGVIDILAWHVGRRAVLIVELKTALVDVGDLLATMDRRLRLAQRIAGDRGLSPVAVAGAWVAVRDTATNRRRRSDHAALLRAAFPDDGRTVGAWLDDPKRPLRAFGFLSDVHHGDLGAARSLPRRVRQAAAAVGQPSSVRESEPEGAHEGPDWPLEPRVGVTFRG
jgi:transcriptional regulator with XRE-family HTH domain